MFKVKLESVTKKICDLCLGRSMRELVVKADSKD
jgi:hypothetical protein